MAVFAERRGLRIIDATCPLVTKVHLEAVRYAREGYTIILIGHKDHDEVIGTLGEAPERIVVIASAYANLIEHFPGGGGGYLVATKLLGPRVGVVSGCALLVDYVLTVTVSIAAAGDALFSLLPPGWLEWKVPSEFGIIAVLIVLNLRGVKESVQILTPIFLLFLLTHPNERQSLTAAGREQASSFTWQRTAKETISVYKHYASL